MKIEIRVQSPGRYQLWVAERDDEWAPLFFSKGYATAQELGTAIADRGQRLGWENIPESIGLVDDDRKIVEVPAELWPILDAIFKTRDRALKK